MDLLSKKLVSLEYRDQLKRDLARATVFRFLVAYISDEGVNSIGRDLLIAALRDSRSFGVSSLTCMFGYEPLLRLQESMGNSGVRLKYFMDPVIDEGDELKGLTLFHSKLVFLAMEQERKAVVYIGSHNWTRRALGPGGSRNAEASLRIEMDFTPTDLDGAGTGLASDVNGHLLKAFQLPACLPATSANRPRFMEWEQKGCRNARSTGLDQNTIVLAVRKDDGTTVTPSQWDGLRNRGIYLQALEEDEGGKLYDNTAHVLVLVWMSEADLRAGNQPTMLLCRGTTQKAGLNSQRRGTNQSLDPITGFDAIILDERQLAAVSNGGRAERRLVTIWSGQRVEVYDFEFPTSRTNSSQVDGSVKPNYQYHLEVEHVVFPGDGNRPDQPGMVWERESFAVVNKAADARIERMPGYLVSPELEMAIKECFETELSLDLNAAKVLPISSIDHAKLGKRLSHHPLHDTFIGANEKRKSAGFYEKAQSGTLVADVDEPTVEDAGRRQDSRYQAPVQRVLRVFTMPLDDLEAIWRQTARDLQSKKPDGQ